jgi:hypothetical protein
MVTVNGGWCMLVGDVWDSGSIEVAFAQTGQH